MKLGKVGRTKKKEGKNIWARKTLLVALVRIIYQLYDSKEFKCDGKSFIVC